MAACKQEGQKEMKHNVHNVYRCIVCPDCNHQFEWLGSRMPNHCPECGRSILAKVLQDLSKYVVVDDKNARVSYADKG
jgi:DNA-directed RNA polymerase subunit RPC12/RpoP